jgi:hypothetical protein
MKRCILIILSLSFLYVEAQDNRDWSSEIDANYYYYFTGNNTNNDFNYGFSLLLSRKLDRLKISSGLSYSTLKYYYTADPTPTNSLEKREYNLRYLNVPLLVAYYCLDSKKNVNILIESGLIVNTVVSYNITSYYLNQPTIDEEGSFSDNNFGLTFRLGTNISSVLINRFILNAGPFVDYKFINNGEGNSPDYRNIPDVNLSIGFRVGVEYNF